MAIKGIHFCRLEKSKIAHYEHLSDPRKILKTLKKISKILLLLSPLLQSLYLKPFTSRNSISSSNVRLERKLPFRSQISQQVNLKVSLDKIQKSRKLIGIYLLYSRNNNSEIYKYDFTFISSVKSRDSPFLHFTCVLILGIFGMEGKWGIL